MWTVSPPQVNSTPCVGDHRNVQPKVRAPIIMVSMCEGTSAPAASPINRLRPQTPPISRHDLLDIGAKAELLGRAHGPAEFIGLLSTRADQRTASLPTKPVGCALHAQSGNARTSRQVRRDRSGSEASGGVCRGASALLGAGLSQRDQFEIKPGLEAPARIGRSRIMTLNEYLIT